MYHCLLIIQIAKNHNYYWPEKLQRFQVLYGLRRIEEFTGKHTEQKEGTEMAQANKKLILSHVRHTIFAVNVFSLLINKSSVPAQGFTSSH